MTWPEKLKAFLAKVGVPAQASYRAADAETIHKLLSGLGLDTQTQRPDAGMRTVFNISSAHLPALLRTKGGGYKNRYDLKDRMRVGSPPATAPSLRERVDQIVANLAGEPDGSTLYYGAIELNGAGIRYFGDVSIVVKAESNAPGTIVLFRNSYDLARAPLRQLILAKNDPEAEALKQARDLAGAWPDDVSPMAALKVLDGGYEGERRLTAGMISGGVLSDEDYLEVVRVGAFGRGEIEELRVSAADAGAEARIGDRLVCGPAPSLAEMQWRARRRSAEGCAALRGLSTRVIVTEGRLR